VVESFHRETVRHEQVFVVPGDTGPMLIYAVEAENLAHARAAYKESSLRIDEEHRAVLQESLLERLQVEPTFACASEPNVGNEAA